MADKCNDSVQVQRIFINPSYNLTVKDTICQLAGTNTWTWRDTTFEAGTVSGDYVFHRTTINGCDSIVTLQLTVKDTVQLMVTGSEQDICLASAIETIPISYSHATISVLPDLSANGLTLTSHNNGKDTISGIPTAAGYYTYVVTASSDNGCAVYDKTDTVKILVYPAFALTNINPDTNYCLNASAEALSVSVTTGSTDPANYQWYRNGVAISGATSNSYIPLTTAAGNFDYSVKVDNGCDNDSVHVANIRVFEAFALTNNSADTSYCLNSTADALSVSVPEGSTSPATYQWYKNGALISGATSNSYVPLRNVGKNASGRRRLLPVLLPCGKEGIGDDLLSGFPGKI